MIRSREEISLAQRIVIKAGTSVVSTPDGFPSLSRIANIVENTANLVRQGKEVLIVTSGAVGIGRQRLKKQALMNQSMSDILTQKTAIDPVSALTADGKVSYNSACAAAGQLGLMTLYETMFNQYNIATSQLLVTAFDFTSPERRRNVQFVISQLLKLGIVPLINENDAVSANQGYQLFGNSFADNDSLAAMVSVELSAQLLILLTDVCGVYDRPPSEPFAKLIDVFDRGTSFKIGDKSLQGRGGMGAKVDAALRGIAMKSKLLAVLNIAEFSSDGGVQAVVIAAGGEYGVIEKILKGDKAGTAFFCRAGRENLSSVEPFDIVEDSIVNPTLLNITPLSRTPVQLSHSCSAEDISQSGVMNSKGLNGSIDIQPSYTVEEVAKNARNGNRQLNAISEELRNEILLDISTSLLRHESEILLANSADCDAAVKRFAADYTRTFLYFRAGVLLIIFESRPDCLPQIAALAIKSGNGLMLKGGKEAEMSNRLLHRIIVESVVRVSGGKVDGGAIGLVSRADIPALLKLDNLIDLVIPRGSSQLVLHIKCNTKIPVMGHAEGVCHVFVDKSADIDKAEKILIDSKTDYPAACNSAECVLLHSETVLSGSADRLLRALRSRGVVLFGGVNAMKAGLTEKAAVDMHIEYSELRMTVEVVQSLEDAVTHIHTYGSGHTESIVTEDASAASVFLRAVDSACVFHNASTRFADGFRFGLGAEVGISTGRIHARGPVGVQGLLTYKWQLVSTSSHCVADFSTSSTEGKKVYTHKLLSV